MQRPHLKIQTTGGQNQVPTLHVFVSYSLSHYINLYVKIQKNLFCFNRTLLSRSWLLPYCLSVIMLCLMVSHKNNRKNMILKSNSHTHTKKELGIESNIYNYLLKKTHLCNETLDSLHHIHWDTGMWQLAPVSTNIDLFFTDASCTSSPAERVYLDAVSCQGLSAELQYKPAVCVACLSGVITVLFMLACRQLC